MERKPENEYSLSPKAGTALLHGLEDMTVVAEDLENMDVGQWCFMSKDYPSSGMNNPKSRAESKRDQLHESLGDRAENYKLKVELSEEDRYTFIVERIK